jgi:hypothetical protein
MLPPGFRVGSERARVQRIAATTAGAVAIGLAAACGSGSSSATTGDSGAPDGSENDSASSSGGGLDAPAGLSDAIPEGSGHEGGTPPGDAGGGTDGGAKACKRGIATNTPASGALAPTASAPGVTWWYDWSNQETGGASSIAFVPMIWGTGTLNGPIPAGSQFLLGFNEPNFKAQSNLTPQQAATDWPKVEALAKAQGIPIVSPAVNFCGSSTNSSGCSDPTVTDPYTWLKDFFAACTACEVDYVAVHWYNCDLPSLKAYIDGSGSLQGFVQFGKPIWLTEFSCDGSHPVAEQQTYMEAAVPYLEGNPNVFRYSWFSSSAITPALLMNPDGSLTSLGTTYVGLPAACK